MYLALLILIPLFFFQVLLFLLPWILPVDFVPYSLTWIYNIFLQLAEPYLLLQEVFFIISQLTEFTVFILIRGSNIHYNENNGEHKTSYSSTKRMPPPSYLRYFALISIVCYFITLTIISKYFEVDWWLGIILILTLLNHFTTWYMDRSLWENTFIFFISTIVIYVMRREGQQRQSSQNLSNLLVLEKSNNASVRSFGWLWQLSPGEKNIVLQVFLTPLFIGKVALRLSSVIWCNGDCFEFLWSLFKDKIEDKELEEKQNTEAPPSSWIRFSPLVYTFCSHFVIVQLVAGQLQELNSESYSTKINWLTRLVPEQIMLGRIFQIILVNGFHLHSLLTRFL